MRGIWLRSAVLIGMLTLGVSARAQMAPTQMAAGGAGHGVKCPQIPPMPAGALGDVDQGFLESYCALEPAVLAHQGPYVVMTGASLILHWSAGSGKAPEKENVIPESYHALKDVAHVPFAVYLLLTPVVKGYATMDTQRAALTTLQERVKRAEGALDATYFSAEEITRQREILAASENVMAKVLQSGTASKSALAAFAKSTAPLLLRDGAEAACQQVKRMHTQMMAWKKQLSAEEWGKLVAVIVSGHQPRYRNVATQYFAWLLGGESPAWGYPGESARVIYAETLGAGEDAASEQLAAMEIDWEASEAFFGNKWRLSEDLLSDGAAACVAKLPAGER